MQGYRDPAGNSKEMWGILKKTERDIWEYTGITKAVCILKDTFPYFGEIVGTPLPGSYLFRT